MPTTIVPDVEGIVTRQKQYLFPAIKTYYGKPLVLVAGKGLWVTDVEGQEYADFFSGILVNGIGHSHPEVVRRVQAQAGRLIHTSTLYISENQLCVAEQLADLAPGQLQQSFFTNSGTEAVETAVMLAQMYTGRSEVIALRYAYAGRSYLSTNLTGQYTWRGTATAIPWIKHARSPDCYRCPYGPPHDDCAAKFADDLEEVIQTTTNGRPAAVMLEPIQGAGGYIVPPFGYIQRVAQIARRYGALLISDEVQTGFGRTGRLWFGIEHEEVVPDILVLAKAIASGLPVGATVTTPEIAAAWQGKTLSTYGGNPLAMTAAAATLEVMRAEDVPGRSEQRGKQLRTGLEELQNRYSWIGDVRGRGLMQALELVRDRESKAPDPERARKLLEAAREKRLLVGLGGLWDHVIRLAPSMLATEEEIDEGLRRLGHACAAAT